MKSRMLMLLLVFSFLCLGVSDVKAETQVVLQSEILYGSDIGIDQNHIVGSSYTAWQNQGITTKGSVTGTLYIFTNGRWVASQSKTLTGRGRNDGLSVFLDGYSSGSWYYEGGEHTGSFWTSTKYSSSGTLQCP
ncbi:MAG: hypothetical protein ACOX6F_00320 [Syntrophomonadaceae bacterium]|jgi:hypothetical protein